MRTKLLGAFITALAITAFAALPSMASAQNVTLRENSLRVPVGATLRATSTGANATTFTGRPSGQVIACATTSIRGQVRTNSGARITFRNGGVFQNAEGGDQCVVKPTNGRLTARVENVTFREDILLQKMGTVVEGTTEVRFTFRLFDPALEPNGPIATCDYEGEIEVTSTVGSDVFHAASTAELEAGSSEGCDTEGDLSGNFRLTRRIGTARVTNN